MSSEHLTQWLKKVAGPQGRATLLLLALVLGLPGLLLALLNGVLRNPMISAEGKLLALLGMALLCLLLALGGVVMASRKFKVGERRSLPLWGLAATAYLLPWLPSALFEATRAMLRRIQGVEFTLSASVPLQPWLFVWQVLLLGGLLLIRKPHSLKTLMQQVRLQAAALRRNGVGALLAGAGLWLGYSFLESTLSMQVDSGAGAAIFHPTSGGWVLLFAASLIAAPLAVELVFREMLQKEWRLRLGEWGSIAAVTVFWGILQGNLYLFLPTCLAGVGFALLRRHLDLPAAVLAHAAFNCLALLAGWGLFL